MGNRENVSILLSNNRILPLQKSIEKKYKTLLCDEKEVFENVLFYFPKLLIISGEEEKSQIKALKENIKTQNIPILLIGNIHEQEIIREWLELGVIDYIDINTFPELLLTKIENILSLQKLQKKIFQSENELFHIKKTMHSIDDLIFELDLEGSITNYYQAHDNPDLYVSPDTFMGKKMCDFLPSHITAKFKNAMNRILVTNTPQRFEYALNIQNKMRWFDCKMNSIQDVTGKILGFTIVARNITEKKQYEENIRLSEQKYKELLESLPLKVFLKDCNSIYISCNKQYAKDLDINAEDIAGKTEFDLFAPELAKKYIENDKKVITSQETTIFEEQYIAQNEQKWAKIIKQPILDKHGNVTKIIGTYWDITEQKQLEEQLIQIEKMQSVSTLVGGIAHDFNNLLAVILGFADIIKEQINGDDTFVLRGIEKITAAGNKAKDLVSQLLIFNREGSNVNKVSIKPGDLIGEIVKSLRKTVPKTITIEENIQIGKVRINANPGQFEQLIVNLCENSCHAMKKNGGNLRITLDIEPSLPFYLQKAFDLDKKEYLKITVKDTGHGIPDAIKHRIFDPYFSTHEKTNAGLGLAIARSIMKEHQGVIHFESKQGYGTIFWLYFPVVSSKKEETSRKTSDKLIQGNNENILFIDDEELLVKLGVDMLTRLGYSVSGFTNSQKALETFKKNPEVFDLVITDQTMPGMRGDELSRKILETRPDIPIILCTGYSNILTEEEAYRIGIKKFLMKPVRKNDIAMHIRKVLCDTSKV